MKKRFPIFLIAVMALLFVASSCQPPDASSPRDTVESVISNEVQDSEDITLNEAGDTVCKAWRLAHPECSLCHLCKSGSAECGRNNPGIAWKYTNIVKAKEVRDLFPYDNPTVSL